MLCRRRISSRNRNIWRPCWLPFRSAFTAVRSHLCTYDLDRTAKKDFLAKYEKLVSMVVPRSAKCVLMSYSSYAHIDRLSVLSHPMTNLFCTPSSSSGEYMMISFKSVERTSAFHTRTSLISSQRFSMQVHGPGLPVLGGSAGQREGAAADGGHDREGTLGTYFSTLIRAPLIRCLQTELLRLSRTNFSEAFQLLVHLKIVRLFVESVLRYGLPSNYVGLVVKVRCPARRLQPLLT
jgi:hypothetical protein